LALDGFDSKKHSGIISAFRKGYVKTGKFDDFYSDMIREAFDIRTDSDYQDFYFISKAEVVEQLENAKIFLKTVQVYVETILREKGQ